MQNNFVKPLFMERMHPMQQGMQGGMNFPAQHDFLNQPAQAARMNAIAPAVNQQMPHQEMGQGEDGYSPMGSAPSPSPITRGSMEAKRAHMATMREMTQPTEEDRQRAFGMALVRWAAERAKPTQTKQSNMGHIVSSMAPAMDTYQNQLAQAAQQNAMLYGAVREDERYERELAAAQAKAAEDKRRHDEKLSETKAHHRAIEGKRKNGELTEYQKKKLENDQKKLERESGNFYTQKYREEGVIGPKDVSFMDLPANALNAQTTRLSKMADGLPMIDNSDEILDRLDKLFDKNPKLGKKLGTAAFEFSGDEGAFNNWLARQSLSKDELRDAQLIFKDTSELATEQTNALGGTKSNFWLNSIKSQKPKAGYSYEANKELIKNLKAKNAKARARAQVALKGLEGQYIPSFESTYSGKSASIEDNKSKINEIRKSKNLGPEIDDDVIAEHYGLK